MLDTVVYEKEAGLGDVGGLDAYAGECVGDIDACTLERRTGRMAGGCVEILLAEVSGRRSANVGPESSQNVFL